MNADLLRIIVQTSADDAEAVRRQDAAMQLIGLVLLVLLIFFIRNLFDVDLRSFQQLEFVSLIQIQHIFLFRSVELHLIKLNAELFMNDQYDLVSFLSNFIRGYLGEWRCLKVFDHLLGLFACANLKFFRGSH